MARYGTRNPLPDRSYARPRGIQSQDRAGHGYDDLAAEAADIDIVAYLKGSAFGFIQHRGITHTFLGIPVIAAVVVGLVWLLDAAWQRLRRGAPAAGSARAPVGMAVSVRLHRGAVAPAAGFHQQLRRSSLLSLLAAVVCLGHCVHH